MGELVSWKASEVPDVKALIADFKNCTPWGDGSWNRVTDNENTRFTRWANQNPDGKKHDQPNKPAFPFDGASDTRIPLADDIINENVAVSCTAFWRAMVKPKYGRSETSSYAVKLLDYYINEVLQEELVREVELSEQYRQTLGWVALHPTWLREVCLVRRQVAMEDLVAVAQAIQQQQQQQQAMMQQQMAQQQQQAAAMAAQAAAQAQQKGVLPQNQAEPAEAAMMQAQGQVPLQAQPGQPDQEQEQQPADYQGTDPGLEPQEQDQGSAPPGTGLEPLQQASPLVMLPEMIMNPAMDNESAAILGQVYEAYAKQQIEKELEMELPPLKLATLKKAVKELREEGKAYLPVPYISSNRPEIVALKPWDEVFVPNMCTDVQKGPSVFRRVWMSEQKLREKILTEQWSEPWVEEAVKHKGKYSTWTAQGMTPTMPAVMLSDAMAGTVGSTFQTVNPNEQLIEVIYATYEQLDEDNVRGIYYTVFNVSVVQDKNGNPLYAQHGLLEGYDGEFPYVTGQRENWSRCITASRGVPQVAATWQREVKVQRDGVIDHTSLGVTPPLLVPKGAMSSQFKFGPAVRNEITPGRSPEMMAIPNLGAKVAMEVSQIVTADADNYFGRMAAEVPPPRVQTKQGMIVTGFLTMWTRAFRQVLSLAQRYMSDAEFSEVTGAPPGWLDQRRSQRNLLSAALHFDVRELDPEFVLGQLKVMNEAILPGDVAGVVDRAKYTRLQLRALSPALAKELVSDQGEASQKLFNDVQRDLAMMFLGNEAQYVENDPTAGAKLKFANQILMSNPNYQQAFKQGGRFAELLKKWEENLQFSLTQQQNAQIGSIGVKPEQMGMGGGMAR